MRGWRHLSGQMGTRQDPIGVCFGREIVLDVDRQRGRRSGGGTMSEGGRRLPRRTDAVVIAWFSVVFAAIAIVLAVQLPWGAAVGDTGFDLCRDRLPASVQSDSHRPGQIRVTTSRSWFPVGVNCEGIDPTSGEYVVDRPRSWASTYISFLALGIGAAATTVLSVQYRRPRIDG